MVSMTIGRTAYQAFLVASGTALLNFAALITDQSSFISKADFFPEHINTFTQTLWIISFTAPLVGAVIAGVVSDRIGRKFGVLLSFALMGAGTIGIALTPPYSSIGVSSQIFFLGFRAIQLFALGAEFGSAIGLLVESAPAMRQCLYVSFIPASASFGALCATLVEFELYRAQAHGSPHYWGWRVLLLALTQIFPLLFVALRNADESPPAEKITKLDSTPLRNSLNSILPGFLVFCAIVAALHMQGIVTMIGIASPQTVSEWAARTIVAGICVTVSALTGGWLSDRYGSGKILLISFSALMLALFVLLIGMFSHAIIGLPPNALFYSATTVAVLRYLVLPSALTVLASLLPLKWRASGLGTVQFGAMAVLSIVMGEGGRPLLNGGLVTLAAIWVFGLFAIWSWSGKLRDRTSPAV